MDFLDFTDVFCHLCLIDKNALGPSLSKMPLDVKQWTCANLVPIRTSEWCQFGSPNGADSDVRMVPIRTSKWCQFGRPNGANSDVRMMPVRTSEWCQFGRPNDTNLAPGRGKRGHQNDGSANALKQMSKDHEEIVKHVKQTRQACVKHVFSTLSTLSTSSIKRLPGIFFN